MRTSPNTILHYRVFDSRAALLAQRPLVVALNGYSVENATLSHHAALKLGR